MKDEMDELLSKAFRAETPLESEANFTAGVMGKLPSRGIPKVTRAAILLLFTTMAISIPLLSAGSGEVYAFAEDTLTDGIITFQYYMHELVYIV